MARKRLAVQLGLGTSIRSRNYTQAAARAIRDALWHNSLNLADAFGFPREAMQIDVELGVPCPEAVDCAALLPIFPYGQVTIRVSRGGLEVAKPDGSSSSVMVNAALVVYFDMEQSHD
ncbi:Lin0512 family protein [Thauera sp. Sel9]|uniref:Lin0512 family protein n=1 Tax=Thauera sp. Sel9 TaxID=2974299 RepID=UPI0021E0FCC1|nr:Lin0512 family protein [Thauera sp. Sel9]MCV2219186.1 Lin0512 family protein [Thauera sp. Sel9]